MWLASVAQSAAQAPVDYNSPENHWGAPPGGVGGVGVPYDNRPAVLQETMGPASLLSRRAVFGKPCIAGEWQHAWNSEQGREPAFPWKQTEQLGQGVGSGIDSTVGLNQVHCRRQRRKSDPKFGDPRLVLKRDKPQLVFPVPPLRDRYSSLANPALAVVDERGMGRTSVISARHLRHAPRHRPRARGLP